MGRATLVALKLNSRVAVGVIRNWILAGWHPPAKLRRQDTSRGLHLDGQYESAFDESDAILPTGKLHDVYILKAKL